MLNIKTMTSKLLQFIFLGLCTLQFSGCQSDAEPQKMAQLEEPKIPHPSEDKVHPKVQEFSQNSKVVDADKGSQDADKKEEPQNFPNPPTSLHELAQRVVKGLNDKDERQLSRLRVQKKEYMSTYLPEFVKDKKNNNLPPDLHWMLIDTESKAGIKGAIQEYGGRELELLGFEVTKGILEFEGFIVHRKIELKLLDPDTGKSGMVRVFDSVVEVDGEFYILSYPS